MPRNSRNSNLDANVDVDLDVDLEVDLYLDMPAAGRQTISWVRRLLKFG